VNIAIWNEPVADLIELVGVAVIVGGAVAATAAFIAQLRSAGFDEGYRLYRRNLGRAILLGLELLVAGDIINTVAVDPTFRTVGVLGLIVLIRTFLSVSLEVEIEGRWPWARSASRPGGRTPGAW